MAFQMAGIIGLGCWGGYKLDQYYHKSNSLFTIIFSLVSIFAALYIVLKEFIGRKD
jgi:F0F1-type ATP synthase assembly protein I